MYKIFRCLTTYNVSVEIYIKIMHQNTVFTITLNVCKKYKVSLPIHRFSLKLSFFAFHLATSFLKKNFNIKKFARIFHLLHAYRRTNSNQFPLVTFFTLHTSTHTHKCNACAFFLLAI